MTYIKDLDPCTYHRGRTVHHLAVGWLDKSVPFNTGQTTAEFRQKLADLVSKKSVEHYRGWYDCNWCIHPTKNLIDVCGNGSIIVKSPITNITYEAPVLVVHYVVDHDYLPPEDFIHAVLAEDV